MKKFFKLLFSRFSIVAIAIILTFILIVTALVGAVYMLDIVLAVVFPSATELIRWTTLILQWVILVITVVHIVNRDMPPETKIPWLLCVVALNVLGVAIYAVFSHNRPSRAQRRRYDLLQARTLRFISVEEDTVGAAREKLGRWSSVSRALSQEAHAPVYANTQTEYFPTGEVFFERLKGDLLAAKHYIFLEYFIIQRGVMWNGILDILKQKVAEGVEVRILYDDIGCMAKIHMRYAASLRKFGIKCVKFNPFVPVISNVHNNRDHRKIAVIDGNVGYTGGINLADEYINAVQPFGYWKDTAVRLEGEAVRGLVIMFLHMYDLAIKSTEDFEPYLKEPQRLTEETGFVQVYGDGPRPIFNSYVGEDLYINILNEAKNYVYITTPYLIIDYRMRSALLSAVSRGVDVRIVVPHIPDKKIAFALTRSNYMALIKGGVKIYEYTPGFIHAKSFLADDEVGVVGTINLDYRSLMHHYENAVFMYKTKAVEQLKEDFEQTFELSACQTEEDAAKNVVSRVLCETAKIFAPLL